MQVACKSQRCIWDTSVKALNALSIHLASSARAKRETLLPLLLLQTLQRCRLGVRAVSTSTLPQRLEVVAVNAATAPEKARAAEVRAAPATTACNRHPRTGSNPQSARQLPTDAGPLPTAPTCQRRPRAHRIPPPPRPRPRSTSTNCTWSLFLPLNPPVWETHVSHIGYI